MRKEIHPQERHQVRHASTPYNKAFLSDALVRLAFGVRVHNLNCAFKLLRRSTLERAGLHEMAATGAAINAELLARVG